MEYYKYIKLTVSNFRNTLFYNLKQFVNKFKVDIIKTIEVNTIFMDDSEESQEDNEDQVDNEEDHEEDHEEDQEDHEDQEEDNQVDKEDVSFSKRKRGELFISIYDSDIENSDEDSEEQEDQQDQQDQEDQEEQVDTVS